MPGTEVDQLELVTPATRVAGTVRVPGDKSIAHRALILGALADGDSVISGLPEGEDLRATVACLRSLGVKLSPVSPSLARGRGSGSGLRVSPSPSGGQSGWGFATPHGPLDYTLRLEKQGLRFSIGHVSLPPGGIALRPPLEAPPRRVMVNGKPVPFSGDELVLHQLPADVLFKR